MTKELFHADNPGGGGAQRCPPGPAASPKVLSAQAMLPLDPSPEEAEELALLAALEKCRKAVAQAPDSAWAWYHYGDALLGLKRPEEAVPALRKAVALCPDTLLFHHGLGLALYDLKEFEAAREQFTGIVANDPQLKCAWSQLVLSAMTNLALSQEKLGQRAEAIQTLMPALDTATSVLFNLGFLHYRAKRFDAALPYAHAAYVLKPNNEDVVHQYGATLMELKQFRKAVKLLRQATVLNPSCRGAWYDLGLAYARQKQRKRARVYFLKSLEVDPNNAWPHYDLACLNALEGKTIAANGS